MAKRKSSAARALAPVIRMQMPAAPKSRRVVVAPPAFLSRTQAAVQKSGRKVGSAAAKFAHDERHTLIAVGAAGVLGLAESRGVDLPKIDALGVAGTYGLAAYLYAKLSNSPTAEKVATGLLSVAVYKMASAPAAGVSGAGKGGRV